VDLHIFSISFLPFGGKKEKEAFGLLMRNSSDVLTVVKKFEEMILAFFSERDIRKAEALGREISFVETRADKGRREFSAALGEGAFLPVLRGDLERLAEELDGVADAAEEAMRAVLLRKKILDALDQAEKKDEGAKVIRDCLTKMAKIATRAVEALHSSLIMLTSDLKASNLKAKEVEELEHETDLLQLELVNDIYRYENLFDPTSIFQLREIEDKIGSITDRAEDTSDIISIVCLTLRA
jgi:predicted phosphate transport protein (TIGR00153 family)